jgi:preprotein translocase subunit SecB
MSFEEFTSINAPALIFPYIREHITAITQKAGIKPIIIQPINFVALAKERENSIEGSNVQEENTRKRD